MSLTLLLAVNSITLGGLLFLLAAGFSLIFGLMRIPNLSHGSFFMLGAYFAVSLIRLGLDFWTAALLAVHVRGGLVTPIASPMSASPIAALRHRARVSKALHHRTARARPRSST